MHDPEGGGWTEGSNHDLCKGGTDRVLYARRSQEANAFFFVKQIPVKDTWVSIQRVHTRESIFLIPQGNTERME